MSEPVLSTSFKNGLDLIPPVAAFAKATPYFSREAL